MIMPHPASLPPIINILMSTKKSTPKYKKVKKEGQSDILHYQRPVHKIFNARWRRYNLAPMINILMSTKKSTPKYKKVKK